MREPEIAAKEIRRDFSLNRGVTVRGCVVDAADGTPIPSANVMIRSRPASAFTGSADACRGVTGPDGQFVLDGAPAGAGFVQAWKSGVGQGEAIALEGKSVLVPVRRRHYGVEVLVVDAQDRPVPAASVQLVGTRMSMAAMATTGTNGRAGLDAVDLAAAEGVTVLAHGFARWRSDRVEHGEVIRLTKMSQGVFGSVVDGKTGRPVRQFRVRVTQASGGSSPRATAMSLRSGCTFVDEGGGWNVSSSDWIEGDTVEGVVSAPGYDDQVWSAQVPRAGLVVTLTPKR